MKKFIILLLCFVSCGFLFTSCKSLTSLLPDPTVKVVNPEAPFIDENIEVIDERTVSGVDRSGNVAGKTARLPVRFVKKVISAFKGESEENPYDRGEPYNKEDFQKDILVAKKEGVLKPEYMRGERYSKAYRAPFLMDGEMPADGMLTPHQIADTEAAKKFYAFQQSIEHDLVNADQYYQEGKFSEALELVEKVLDLDASSQEARVLFEKCIKAREEDRLRQEQEMRVKITKHEKINQYLSEAERYLAERDYDEALRICEKAINVDPMHEGALELKDTIELAKFETDLKLQGFTSAEILERMIYEHLRLYKQYTDEKLISLANKELRKVSILESYKDKLSELNR